MPRGDGTGPMGYGPMTGRAMGYCAGYAVPGYMNPGPGGYGMGFGRGWGRGMGGRGRGWGYGYGRGYAAPYAYPPFPAAPYAPPVAPPNEGDYLKNRASYLEQELEGIKQRLSELETEEAE